MARNYYKFTYFIRYGVIEGPSGRLRTARGLVLKSNDFTSDRRGYVKTTRHNLVNVMGLRRVRTMEEFAGATGTGREYKIG